MATIEIDGKQFETENGKMIIEVADEAGIHIPRFCYHKKLSVAANCRMCLVEVENSRKPVPACATPITNGMKVFTKSEQAVHSQQAVMAFLLINHPLDCPICDQGGECELQDVSMGYGEADSSYTEAKRSVEDDNLGTLIATEMTRCIHCTRCVRFGDEIAGVRELGATGRGEHMQIGTYIEHSMTSEVSANVIDLCPVGALTSKPYRFTARAWELSQSDSIAPHDCLGTNVHLHVRRNELMRVVPKENESINETWISDRDRFSYLALKSSTRAQQPRIKRDGQWETVDWQTALKFTAEGLSRVIKQHGPEQVAAFSSVSATLEEQYLLQKFMRDIGVNNLDYRLQQTDFSDQDTLSVMPQSSLNYADLDKQQNILIVGSNLHREIPLAALRVRKAFVNGAQIFSLNAVEYDYHFGVQAQLLSSPLEFSIQLATILSALVDDATKLPDALQKLLIGLKPGTTHQLIAKHLQLPKAVIVMGAIAHNHPQASIIRMLTHWISKISGAKILAFTAGANTAGAALAGMLPHRGAAMTGSPLAGLNVQEALDAKLKAYVLLGVEPGYDFAHPHNARQSMLAAEFVVLMSAFDDESMRDYADVILPMASFGETSGTYINVDLTWQSFKGAMTPKGEARPAWKILRVLANLFHCKDFDYASSEEILLEVKSKYKMMGNSAYEAYYPLALPIDTSELVRVGECPLYRVDALVRRSKALQYSASSETAQIRINPITATRLNLGEVATVSQGDIEITLPLKRDERIAADVVWVANAMPETVDLGHAFAAINIKR